MNVCIPFGNQVLVLTENEFQEARNRGQQIMITDRTEAVTVSNDRVLDAKGMSEVTGIPDTWFLDQARQRNIPCIRAGKYVRFKESEILKHLSVKNK